MQNQVSSYRFDEDLPDTPMTVIGLGETGAATLDYVYGEGFKNVAGLSLVVNPDSVRTSISPDKLLLSLDESGRLTNQEQLTALIRAHSFWRIVVVADLADAECRQLAPALVRLIAETIALPVVPILLLPPTGAESVGPLLAALRSLSKEILVIDRPTEETTFEPGNSMNRSPRTVRCLAHAIRALLEMSESEKYVCDISVLNKLVQQAGRIVISAGRARGPTRANDAVLNVLAHMERQQVDSTQIQCLLILVAFSREHHLRLQEQMTIQQLLANQLAMQTTLVNMSIWKDDMLDDRIEVKTWLWLPDSATQ